MAIRTCLFRHCCAKMLNDEFPVLGANGDEVQIDESVHSKKPKYNIGAISPSRWVFGMIQPSTGYKKFFHVRNRSRATLLPIILQYIAPGAIVVSDCWLAYNTLSNYGYQHFEVNHEFVFKCPLTGYHTNTIESCWKHTKKSTINDGGCDDDHLQLKLDVHSFRSMFVNEDKDNAFVIVAKAIAENWQHFK